jgi:predicted acetyltransferase
MITLLKPSKIYQKEIFDYKKEMIDNGNNGLSGCGGLDKHDNYDDWMNDILQYQDRNTIPNDSSYVEGSQWLLMDPIKNRLLGMVNIRHYLNDHLVEFGGHIGYSVRPSERRKGYAKLQLQLALDFLKTLDVKQVLVTCDDQNIASYKTIESCGGVLEDVRHSKEYGMVRRYWIDNA